MKPICHETLELLLDRRSVRSFTEQPVSEAQIQSLLEAGFYAPSSHARFPTHFVTVSEPELLAQLASALPSAKLVAKAPLAIVVCGDVRVSWNRWTDDCIAAGMNIITAAEALGLSSCWCATYPQSSTVEGICKLLALPDGVLPYLTIAIGTNAREPKPRPERVVASRIHRERW
ncbi:MAG: nitroreductase family protein [Oscillospiraceae bacterium]